MPRIVLGQEQTKQAEWLAGIMVLTLKISAALEITSNSLIVLLCAKFFVFLKIFSKKLYGVMEDYKTC